MLMSSMMTMFSECLLHPSGVQTRHSVSTLEEIGDGKGYHAAKRAPYCESQIQNGPTAVPRKSPRQSCRRMHHGEGCQMAIRQAQQQEQAYGPCIRPATHTQQLSERLHAEAALHIASQS